LRHRLSVGRLRVWGRVSSLPSMAQPLSPKLSQELEQRLVVGNATFPDAGSIVFVMALTHGDHFQWAANFIQQREQNKVESPVVFVCPKDLEAADASVPVVSIETPAHLQDSRDESVVFLRAHSAMELIRRGLWPLLISPHTSVSASFSPTATANLLHSVDVMSAEGDGLQDDVVLLRDSAAVMTWLESTLYLLRNTSHSLLDNPVPLAVRFGLFPSSVSPSPAARFSMDVSRTPPAIWRTHRTAAQPAQLALASFEGWFRRTLHSRILVFDSDELSPEQYVGALRVALAISWKGGMLLIPPNLPCKLVQLVHSSGSETYNCRDKKREFPYNLTAMMDAFLPTLWFRVDSPSSVAKPLPEVPACDVAGETRARHIMATTAYCGKTTPNSLVSSSSLMDLFASVPAPPGTRTKIPLNLLKCFCGFHDPADATEFASLVSKVFNQTE